MNNYKIWRNKVQFKTAFFQWCHKL